MSIQSSPSNPTIIEAGKTHRNLFVANLVWVLFASIVTGILTWLVWRASNKQQDLVTAELNAGTAAANAVAKVADEKAATANAEAEKAKADAAEANAEAAKANQGLAKSNEEIARLNAEAKQANKQIEVARADAAKAKEGIANAEARSREASVEVAKLQIVVANAEKERAQAQKALLELQQRLADRVITDASARRIIEQTKQYKDREFQVVTFWDDREPLATAQRLADILVTAGWKLNQPKEGQFLLNNIGIEVWFHPEASAEAKQAAEALVSALNSAGLSAVVKQMNDPGKPIEKIHINVGTKPR